MDQLEKKLKIQRNKPSKSMTVGFMGVELDNELNAKIRGTETVISTPASKVKVVVIPTDEELMIARDTEAIVNGRQPE